MGRGRGWGAFFETAFDENPRTWPVALAIALRGRDYLIVGPTEPLILHHTRGTGDTILTHIMREGSIMLDPPGLELRLADVYGEK